MAYQSLYRRYRSQRFDEVLGQDHVTLALRNAVREGRVAQGYLFSGPRGTGKTSTARILAKVLNCLHPVDGEPDTTCENCQAVEHGRSVDWLQELDAASNNKVDDMRDLLSRVSMGTSGNRKVYILDEVHMLSTGASNALLKTLEEPPEHVIFVLATTEPKKVLPTIRSRTQHFDFKLLSADVLADHVRHVIADAELDLGEDSVDYVVRAGAGSARDTLSALDQVAAAGGVTEFAIPVDDIVDAIGARDPGAALTAVDASVRAGRDPRILAETLITSLREAFLVAMGAPASGLSEQAATRAATVAQNLGPASLTRALEAIGTAMVDMRQAPDTRIPLEVALIRLTRVDVDGDITALAARIERLEQALASGTAGVATGTPAGSASAASPGAAAPGPSQDAATSPTDAATSPSGAAASPTGAAPSPSGVVASPAGAGSSAGTPAPTPTDTADPDRATAPGPAPAPATGAPMDRPRGAEAARAKLAQRETTATAAPAPSAAGVGTRPSLGGVRRARDEAAPDPASTTVTDDERSGASASSVTTPSPAGSEPADASSVTTPDRAAPAPAARPADASSVTAPSPAVAEPIASPVDSSSVTIPDRSAPGPSDPIVDTPSGDGPPSGDAKAPSAGPLDRATIAEAWDTVLGSLKGRAKALYKLGQFVESDERTARFALPNTAHRDRCEDKRDEVQAALRAHFGFDVPIVLVVDGDAAQAPRLATGAPEQGAPADGAPNAGQPTPVDVMDDEVDMDELIDAPDTSVGGIAQLQDAFPGAELTED